MRPERQCDVLRSARTRSARYFAIVLLISLILPRPVNATSCAGGASIVTAYRFAAAMFVAAVERVEPPRAVWTREPDGSYSGSITSGSDDVVFSIQDVFNGAARGRVQLKSDFRFKENERYVVYAGALNGTLDVSVCSRTRLLSEAAEDLKFVDGLRRSIPQGVLWGLVLEEGKNTDPVDVVALRSGIYYRVHSQRDGYHMVLAPGTYLVWVERDGRTLVNAETIEVRDGEERAHYISFKVQR